MSVLITSDLHFSDNPRDAYRFTFMKWLVNVLEREAVHHVLILGDLTEEKDRHSAWLVNTVTEHINTLSDERKVTILKGNHDYLVEDSPFFEFLRCIPDVSWIGNPTPRKIKGLGNCLFLPHNNNYKKDWVGLLDIDYDWVFAHQTFEGANIGPRRLEGIPLSVFDKQSRIISGDIHVPQKIGKLTYVGAPYTVDFGDNYQARVLLIDGGKVTSIPYEGPQKRLVECGSTPPLNVKQFNDGDLLKIRVKLERREYDQWAEIREETRRIWTARGYVVETIQPVMETRPLSYHKRDSRTDEELVRAFAKRASVSKGTLLTGLKLL